MRAQRAPLVALAEVDALRASRYLPMRDGTPIAVDVYVPASAASAPVATIVRQTRYARSLLPRRPFARLVHEIDHYQRLRRAFLAAGFAWVDVDVRGSGASGGTQYYCWNPDEVRDGAEVVDWVVRQPWSSGKVGSLGISYDGTSAEMLLVNQHPAVRAVAPMFSLFDAFADVALPGGIHLTWFYEQWARFNELLDRNAPHEAFAHMIWMLARTSGWAPAWIPDTRAESAIAALLASIQDGVRPVDPARLPAAVAAHAENYRVDESVLAIAFRDDRGVVATHPEATTDSFSPHTFAAEVRASGAAVYSYSGWRDGAYVHGAIQRYMTLGTPGSRLLLGPWIHSGRAAVCPFARSRTATFDHAAELIGFFRRHLQGRDGEHEVARIKYFTLGEQRWKTTDTWPPPGAQTQTLYLAGNRRLAPSPPAAAGYDRYRIDVTAGSGARSRWRSLIAPIAGDYPDRARRDARLLVYDAPPLVAPLEVTGHPVVTVHAAWLDCADGQLFAYLEDVAPDGRVAYVTEGMLRALHRKVHDVPGPTPVPQRSFLRADAMALVPGEVVELRFDLLPVSYRYAAGHRVRLALAGGDADSFAAPRPGVIDVVRSPGHPSRIELPVIAPAR